MLLDWKEKKAVTVKLDPGAFLPTRAHRTDAGLDLYTPVDRYLNPGCSVVIDTGVHIELPHGTFGKLESKSGLNLRGVVSCGGVIDEGYTGSIQVKLYNLGHQPYAFRRGDKVVQLIVQPCEYVTVTEGELKGGTDRGENGFGSTGR